MGGTPSPINRIDDTSQIPFNNAVTTLMYHWGSHCRNVAPLPPLVGGVLLVSWPGSHIISNIELSSTVLLLVMLKSLPFLVSH